MNEKLLFKALINLLQEEDPYAFVIIEEPKSKHFVQFARAKENDLLFDLPTQQMSEDEFKKATELLANYGIEPKTIKMYSDQSLSEVKGEVTVFSNSIHQNIDLAIELTEQVLSNVFGISMDTPLEITTSWEE